MITVVDAIPFILVPWRGGSFRPPIVVCYVLRVAVRILISRHVTLDEDVAIESNTAFSHSEVGHLSHVFTNDGWRWATS